LTTTSIPSGGESVVCIEYEGEGASDYVAELCVQEFFEETKEPNLDGGCARNGVTHACQQLLEDGLVSRNVALSPEESIGHEMLCELAGGEWVMLQ